MKNNEEIRLKLVENKKATLVLHRKELDFVIKNYGKYPKKQSDLIDLRRYLWCLTMADDFYQHHEKEIISSLLEKVKEVTGSKT
jgi:hypothetical protein